MQFRNCAMGLVAALAAAPAEAETLKFLTNSSVQSLVGGTEVVLDRDTGATVVKFKLDKPAIVVVSFTAACWATGNAGSGANALIAVKLQGQGSFKTLPPSSEQPMCRVDQSGSVEETTTIVGGMEMPKGVHRVKVNAAALNFANATLRATALRIEN